MAAEPGAEEWPAASTATEAEPRGRRLSHRGGLALKAAAGAAMTSITAGEGTDSRGKAATAGTVDKAASGAAEFQRAACEGTRKMWERRAVERPEIAGFG